MVSQTRRSKVHSIERSTHTDPALKRRECLVLRNYDGRTEHEVTVRFRDTDGAVALRTTNTVAPLGALTVGEPIDRAVYRVTVAVDGQETETANCLVGDGPTETVLVEIGNGLVSVSEGVM